MSLLERTQKLLTDRIAQGDSLRKIAQESNGLVDHEWLKKFSAGKVADPGVNRVQRLHDALTADSTQTAA